PACRFGLPSFDKEVYPGNSPDPREGDVMQVQAYLNFDGRCEEAIEFYRRALGVEVTALMRMKDSPEPAPPGTENKIMHATFQIGETSVMASDCHSKGQPVFQGFSLAVAVPDVATADR